jgi:hypothetical protein
MPTARLAAVAASLLATLALAACGSEEQTASSTQAAAQQEADATPAQAVSEIGEVRAALDAAMIALKGGDAAKADEVVSEGYLQHFEKVEGPLDKVDHELNEKLEETIREELRDKIKSGASASEVENMVTSIKADLDTAEQKLQQ